MTKLQFNHSKTPILYKNKPSLQRFAETIFGMFFYSSPVYILTRSEKIFFGLLMLGINMLVILGILKSISPLITLIQKCI